MDFKEKYFNLWREAWNFHKRWFTNKGSPKEWEKIVEESGELCRQQSEPFLRELMMAVISELEREDRRRKNGDMQEAGEMANNKNIDKR